MGPLVLRWHPSAIVHGAGDAACCGRSRVVAASLTTVVILATLGLHTGPANALDMPPVTDPEATAEDPSPVTAEPQAAIPDQDPSQTTEPPVVTQDPPPPTTEPTVPVQEPPPPQVVEPGPGDSLVVTPMTVFPGQTIEVEARTFLPGYPVWFQLGNPARLPLAQGTKNADESGVVRMTLRVSELAEPGTHPFFVSGERSRGMTLIMNGSLTVVPAQPAAVPPPASTPPDPNAVRSLPRTGSGSVGLAGLGTALVGAGSLLATLASKRRNRLDNRPSGPAAA
jgi:LPXTG-motif cell wall-anchored protein